jgi:inorganic pyrophosphatase
VRVRVIGVIVAEQTERSGVVERNDRLIAVAEKSRRHETIRAIRQLPSALVREIEHFFVSYNQVKGKQFTPCGRFGPARALRLVRDGIARAMSQ